MLYVGIDPGKNIGFCLYNATTQTLERAFTIPDFNIEFLFDTLEAIQNPSVTIITERYRVYPGLSHQQSLQEAYAPKINGALWLLCRQKKWTYVEQWAAEAKAYATDGRLKQQNWFKGDRHTKDALRHLMFYLQNVKMTRLA